MSFKSVVVSTSEMDDLKKISKEVLHRRKGEIVDDKLDGVHWFLAILQEAKRIQLRRRTCRHAA